MSPLQASPFLERLLRFLIPYFTGLTADVARAEALETLAAYGARTRAELLSAVQIIVFSFAALETLTEAQTTDMSSSLRLRFRGCANNLNRSSQKTEQTLAERLACDVPEAPLQEPIEDMSDDVAEEMMQQIHASIQDSRNYAAAARAARISPLDTLQTSNQHALDAGMMNPSPRTGTPIQRA